MNANNILKEDMTLEQKLDAIDRAMANAQEVYKSSNPGSAPLDPSDLTMCEGCQ